jgi:putative glycosyltransferase (TIGR04372 family)
VRSIKALGIFAAFALVWFLRPFVTVRFGSLFVSRLGHLAGNTECYLCERDAGMRPKRSLDIWVPQGTPANTQLLKMFSRVMWIAPWGVLVDHIGKRFKWWEKHQFSDAQWGRDIHNLMEKQPPHLSFTKEEERRGEEGLRALGIPEGARWVCLIARDSFYLKAKGGGVDYSYHDFRDSDIQTYRAAAVALMEKGYYVIRMGAYVKDSMKLAGTLFIDYAVSNRGSDFMDVYLGAKCAFCISNGTGFDGIPMIFRRPVCFVNETPFEYLSTWMKDSLAIWKHHEKDGKRMSVAEIVESGAGLFSKAEEYAAAGITLVENTPEEIKDVALEMLEPRSEPQALQAFWNAYPRSKSPHNGIPLHGEARLRIGAKFLESYEN